MSNEFIARNGLISLKDATISGSLNVTSGITGSLLGTASYATLALSASYFSGSISSAVSAISASYALTASYAMNGGGSSTPAFPYTGSAIISGSLTVTGSANIAGVLKLDPSIDPGSLNTTSSYLFSSASNTSTGFDLYYRQDGNIVKFKWLEGGISTGLLYGGVVSGSGTTIYVGSGSGLIMTSNASLSKEINPMYTYVTWNAYSASATYLTSSQNTYLYVDNTGVVRQQSTYFTATQYQESICLGRVTHANYSTITGIGSNVQTTYDSDAQQSEFIRAFGPLKINGLTISGQAGTLRINVGAGQSYNLGGFYPQNPDHPSGYTSNAFSTASMARARLSGSNVILDNNGGAGGTTTATASIRFGGSGGGGGAFSAEQYLASDIPATVTVTVGNGGAGGTASSNLAGTAGSNGGNSSFGTYTTAYGGGGGAGGAIAAAAGGGGGGGGTGGAGSQGSTTAGNGGLPVYGGTQLVTGTVGGQGSQGTVTVITTHNAEFGGGGGGGHTNVPANSVGGGSLRGGGGGGCGAGSTAANAQIAAAAGGAAGSYVAGTGGAAGTNTPATAGTAGADGNSTVGGSGGGGGGSSNVSNAAGAPGGKGGLNGGGGGGGGVGNGTGLAGAGGLGGTGRVIVFTW